MAANRPSFLPFSHRLKPSMLDRALPPVLLTDPETVRRGRLFVVVLCVLFAGAAFFSWSTMAAGQNRLSLVSLVLMAGGVCATLNIPLLWWTKDLRLPSLLLCAEHLLFVWLAAFWGEGIGDASVWWLSPGPVIAAFLLGQRAAVIDAIVASVGVAALWGAQLSGMKFLPRGPDFELFITLASVTVFFALCGMAIFYERTRRESLEAVNLALRDLQRTNSELARMAEELSSARDRAQHNDGLKSAFIENMRLFNEKQTDALRRTQRFTEQLASTIQTVAENADAFSTTARQADGTVESVGVGAHKMQATIEAVVSVLLETDAALGELQRAVGQVQLALGSLRTAADDTGQSMVVMERSSAHVEERAKKTAELATAVTGDAERGREAVRRSLLGVDEIRASSEQTGRVILDLSERIAHVARILAVIDEVASETNVLALNASIIAAQAGERGRGFSVVAEQIKALASRVASSTRESAEVLADVTQRADLAVAQIGKSASVIEQGVGLSRDAATALEQILASAHEAHQMAQAINSSTAEQAHRARDVGFAMGGVQRLVSGALDASAGQARATRLIDETLGKVGDLAPELGLHGQQQVSQAQVLKQSISRVSEMATALSAVQSDQARASRDTLRAVEELHDAQRRANEALDALQDRDRWSLAHPGTEAAVITSGGPDDLEKQDLARAGSAAANFVIVRQS